MPNTDWFGDTEVIYIHHTPDFTNLTVGSRKQSSRELQSPVTEDMIEVPAGLNLKGKGELDQRQRVGKSVQGDRNVWQALRRKQSSS